MIHCYITDRHSLDRNETLLDCMARNAAAGVDWIQIREKDLPARDLLALVRAALRLPAKFLVNSRVDIAALAGAGGVHLPANSPSPRQWRGVIPGADFLIGVSCHTLDEVRVAAGEGAGYVLFGPVFAPLSKATALPARGLDALARAAAAVRIPVLALGGITRENTAQCIAAGAAGIAGISLFQRPGYLPGCQNFESGAANSSDT